ncbi:MAG: DUF5615 family PIN-like protein [Armatimonadota bacterium]
MRFLADEGVERAIVEALRANGYDVLWIVEIARGAEDTQVATLALQEQRILITNDKDFGNMVVRQGYALRGVVLLRLPRLSAIQKAERAVQAMQLLGMRVDGHFVVVTEHGIRLRPLRVSGATLTLV